MRALLDSPDTFITRYHRHHTGITSWAYARGRTPNGRSSYDLLAELVPAGAPHKVLDLGCGDGFLVERMLARGVPADRIVGLDLSPDELSQACKRPGVSDMTVLCERADAISLDRGSVGHVLAHLSLMVMSNIERVVAEVARVLVPGGIFSAILPGPRPRQGTTGLFLEVFDETYNSQKTRAPQLGDARTKSEEGLRELFCTKTGFGSFEMAEFELCFDGTVMEVWNVLSVRYEAYVILPSDRAAMRKRFAQRASELASSDGTVPCSVPIRQIMCRRAPALG